MGRKHTPEGANADSLATNVVERKIKPGGIVHEYPCTLVRRQEGVAVIRYEIPGGGGSGLPITIPPGSHSFGIFWKRRPYNCYRLTGPDGAVLAYRFDAVTAVRIEDGLIEYRDLVLDWWALPDGTLLEEDRDELGDLAASGVVSAADAAEANVAAYAIFSRYRHIIDEVEALIVRA